LKWVFNKQDGWALTRFVWLRIRTRGRPLWRR